MSSPQTRILLEDTNVNFPYQLFYSSNPNDSMPNPHNNLASPNIGSLVPQSQAIAAAQENVENSEPQMVSSTEPDKTLVNHASSPTKTVPSKRSNLVLE